jgi:hypothetical protein
MIVYGKKYKPYYTESPVSCQAGHPPEDGPDFTFRIEYNTIFITPDEK